MRKFLLLGALLLACQLTIIGLTGCATSRPFVAVDVADWADQALPHDSTLAYEFFLIGDAGSPPRDRLAPTFRLLQQRLEAARPEASGVVFLGDNIYCCGLPDSTNLTHRIDAERRMDAQLDLVRDFEGRVVFIPGNHDWNHSGPEGLRFVQRQEDYVEAALDGRNVFLPNNGFPGPVVRKLTDHLVLIVVDTEWLLTDPENKPFGDAGNYEINEAADVFLELHDLLRKYDDETVIIAAHHPLYSNGGHAGFFPLKTHLFPLTLLFDKAYLPLPLLGSIYPLYIRLAGGPQDLAHSRYQAMRSSFLSAMGEHERLIFASGHEHTLQLFEKPNAAGEPVHFIVSGSGSKVSATVPGRGATYAEGAKGFAVLRTYTNGESWLSFWTPEGDGTTGTLRYREQVKPPLREAIDPEIPATLPPQPSYSDSVRTQAANPDYQAGTLKRLFWGAHNREIWATPVTVPYIDLGTTAGGLTPVKRGGGMQTYSLRLEGADGIEYVLRSVDKDPSVSIPENLRETVARDIVQDQIASIHPYGAYVIPPLAAAAGVMHTNPRLVYVPDDPRLGIYQEQFGRQLMMFEERPDGPMEGWVSYSRAYGPPEDIISANGLYEEIDEDNDHRVDQDAFARARLFDMFLSDWDRHRHQWRWAAYEPPDSVGKIYRPVPRDRDWALNRFDGLFPTLMKNFIDPKFQEFDASYGFIKGLARNGFEQDRRFTNELERADWLRQARHLQAHLTDDVIAEAVAQLPTEVAAMQGEEIARIMRARRDQLPDVAETYYEVLARVIDLVGSHKHEQFEVVHFADSTVVALRKTTREGTLRRTLYTRTFFHDETYELRLYGFDGNDTFLISGESKTAPRLLLVGGPGDDTYVDASRVAGRANTEIYDTRTGNNFAEAGPEARLHLSDRPTIHRYNPRGYQYNVVLPKLSFDANPDDGVFLGGGVSFVRHAFRKQPFSATHTLVGNVATRTQAFNVRYEGLLLDALGPWDLAIVADWRSPDNIRNFYGLGNETTNDLGDREFYRARLTEIEALPVLRREWLGALTFHGGPRLYYVKVRNDNRFIRNQPGISPATFDDQFYAGAQLGVTLRTLDRPVNPRQGVAFQVASDLNVALNTNQDDYAQFATDLTFYVSPHYEPQVTLALRVGGAHNVGNFPFYDANTLGGKQNLRGWLSTRYAGRTSFYQNAELRARLFRFSTYIALGELGLLGFADNGRVWTDGESSSVWHQGYGGGLWMTLFDLIAVTGSVGFSEEDTTVSIRAGFLF